MLISKDFWKTLGGLVFRHQHQCGMFAVADLPCAGLNAAWPGAPAQVTLTASLVIAQWFRRLQTIWAVCAMPDTPNNP